MNESDVIERLRAACEMAGSQRSWALLNDFSPSFISDVLLGRRSVTDRLAKSLGFKVVLSYQRHRQEVEG